MDRAKIADTKPVVLDLAPGRYVYCTCGESADQPFCDGAHAGTGFEPREFTVAERERAALCACKRSREEPFCDGAHRLYREGESR
jgi:CDGSH-type Zn-finger protein